MTFMYTNVIKGLGSSKFHVGGTNLKLNFITIAPGLAAVLALFMMITYSGMGSGAANTTFGQNEQVANGQLLDNLSLIEEEQNCVAAEHPEPENVPWFPSLVNTEQHDSARTKVWNCAHFTGSYMGPNHVNAYQSTDLYPVPLLILTGAPNEMYVIGGPAAMPTYVSRVEVGSLKEIWRTNLNSSAGAWLLPAAGNVLADGGIAVTNGPDLYKLNGSTGDIEMQVSLPTGKNLPADSVYQAMEAFKDGTLVLTTANRPPGCTVQGFQAQFGKCPGQIDSYMVAVDPDTFKVLSSVQLPQPVPARNTIAQFQGKEYIYLISTTDVFRYEWNGKNLTLDSNWGYVPVSNERPDSILRCPSDGGLGCLNDKLCWGDQ